MNVTRKEQRIIQRALNASAGQRGVNPLGQPAAGANDARLPPSTGGA